MKFVVGWDDVGDFSSLAELLPAESNQPRILGDHNLGMYPTRSYLPMTRR
jgi:mannose-1-phosphate guanylyltransferase